MAHTNKTTMYKYFVQLPRPTDTGRTQLLVRSARLPTCLFWRLNCTRVRFLLEIKNIWPVSKVIIPRHGGIKFFRCLNRSGCIVVFFILLCRDYGFRGKLLKGFWELNDFHSCVLFFLELLLCRWLLLINKLLNYLNFLLHHRVINLFSLSIYRSCFVVGRWLLWLEKFLYHGLYKLSESQRSKLLPHYTCSGSSSLIMFIS